MMEIDFFKVLSTSSPSHLLCWYHDGIIPYWMFTTVYTCCTICSLKYFEEYSMVLCQHGNMVGVFLAFFFVDVKCFAWTISFRFKFKTSTASLCPLITIYDCTDSLIHFFFTSLIMLSDVHYQYGQCLPNVMPSYLLPAHPAGGVTPVALERNTNTLIRRHRPVPLSPPSCSSPTLSS